ncbi:MAG TPA: hypothetical protein VFH34_14290 [Anaerolineales bacterium]|nr:hypothetical protein [Anaerolineales bacterium]
MPEGKSLPVEFDELLAAEFNYIAQTAVQANEDRARVSSFYLIAVGSAVAALLGTQLLDINSPSRTVNLIFSGLFALLTLLGTSTVMQLARLRSAWYESALAMNQLKDYMITQNTTLNQAFRWKTSTLPSIRKKDSISYYQALEVALISGLMLGAAAFFLQRAFLPIGFLHWVLSGVIAIATIYLQLALYRRALR